MVHCHPFTGFLLLPLLAAQFKTAGRSKDGTRGRLCFQRERRALALWSSAFPPVLAKALRGRPCCCYCSGKGCGESARRVFLASFSSSLSNLGVEGRPGLGRRALPGKARARSPQDKKQQRAGGTRGVRPIRSDRASPFVCVREGTVVSGDGGEGVGRASALGSRPAPSSSSRR